MKKRIAILGSTGSVGKQTLEVVAAFPQHFDVEVLTANRNIKLLVEQAEKFNPNVVIAGDETFYEPLSEQLSHTDIKVYAGTRAIEDIVSMETIDMVVIAIVGFEGLMPLLSALNNQKPVALANKESLVIAGDLITRTAVENGTPIIPVDSEHSALFQCLMGEGNNPVEKIMLTASGGPFRKLDRAALASVTPEGALNHPNWKMGDKISVDSATLMNKGMEALEAKWLFGLEPGQIEVAIHPQSIIHSLVYFADGNVKAQLSYPDMRLPIQFALTYPNRLPNTFNRLDLLKTGNLTFEAPNVEIFRNLALAFDAMKKGGNVPCALNAANETVVNAFLDHKIGFLQMTEIIEQTVATMPFIKKPTLRDYLDTDRLARKKTKAFINDNVLK